MNRNGKRKLGLRERLNRWLLGDTYVDLGPDKYVIEIHEGKLPPIKKAVITAIEHPLVSSIIAGLVVAAIVAVLT